VRSFSLSKHLLFLTLFAALPLIVVSFFVVDRLVQADREAIRKSLTASAQSLASAVSGEIEEALVIARMLARSRPLLTGNLVEFQNQVFELMPFFSETEIHLSGLEGQKLLSLDQSGRMKPSLDSTRPLTWDLAKQVLQTGQPRVSDVEIDQGKPVIVIHVPVIRNSVTDQILSMHISTARFQKLLTDKNHPEDWGSGILDTKGNFVARIPDPSRVGTPATEGWRAALARSRSGLFENVLAGGDVAVTAYTGTSHGWTAGVAVRKSILDTPVYRTLWMLAILAGLSLFVSLLCAWLIGRRLASGVRILEGKASELTLGRPIATLSMGVNEYDRLLNSLAEASALLKQREEQRSAFETSLIASEAFLNAAIAVSDVTVYNWDLQSDLVSSDLAFKQLWGLAADAQPTSSDLVELIHPDDRRMVQEKIARLRSTGSDGLFFAEFRILPADKSRIRWIACRSRWSRFVDGKPVTAVGAARDITLRQMREIRLLQQQNELRDLADAMPQLVWSANSSGQITYFNQRSIDYQVKADLAEWEDFIHPEDLAPTNSTWKEALDAGVPYSKEHRLKRADGTFAWHLSRAMPLHDSEGNLTKWVGTSTDIDERKQHEKHIHVLMGEVNHRSKNILTVIQSIARLTSSSTATLPEFQSKFAARLQALADSQDLLVNQNWHGVDLNELALLQLSHYVGLEGARIRISGARVFLAAAAAQSIGMALHELSTNAAKYGALSNQEGSVDLSWSIGPTPEGQELALVWTEKNGPAVDPPTRRGFGTAVIERMLIDSLGGQVDLLFPREGVCWRFRAPLANIVGKSEV
jgi:PAS domain S-box-containing protein